MDVFIGEYVVGGGYAKSPPQSIPPSQRREGKAMLQAIAEDFAEVADRVRVAVDPRLSPMLPRTAEVHSVHPEPALWTQWLRAAEGCDSALLIVPETGGMLAQGVAVLQAAGIELMNGFGDFLRCASDKWETARLFAAAGVPHPPTWTHVTVASGNLPPARRWVVKPRDGCGTENVQVFDDVDTAVEAIAATEHLMQPWIEGRAASIAAIISGTDVMMLPAVSQQIGPEDLAYRGGQGPLGEEDQRRAVHLASLAIRALPRRVCGYVGFDIVLANDPDQDCVIEVNPRVTTSYVGLRHIVEGNLAARLLGLDRSPVRCAAECDAVSWNAEGEVWFNLGPCDTFR